MTAHEIHALSGAYALDALDDLERTRFEQHLAVCAECRAEVAGLREAGALLGEGTEATPPPAMRDAVLAQIRTTRPLPPEALRPEPAATGTRRIRWNRLAAAAAVIAVVGVGAVTVESLRDEGSVQVQPGPVQRVLTASDAESVIVDLSDKGRLRLIRSVSEGKAVLVTRGLVPPPSGKVYQLWLQDASGNFVSAGLMPDAGDRQVLLDGNAARAKGAGITVEPPGGSPQPTTTPVALFDLSKAT